MCRPHLHTLTPAQRAFGRDHTQHTITPGITDLHLNHAQHTITLCITGAPHNELSYHTLHHGRTAQRAFVPHAAPRGTCTTEPARRAFEKRNRLIKSKMGCRPRAPDAERPAHQPPRARHENGQNAFDLAREAVGCMGVFGAPVDDVRVVTSMRRPHAHPITPAERALI
jgi:hypothetical protein